MTFVIAGATGAGSTHGAEGETPARTLVWSHAADAESGSAAGLAEALVAFETEVSGQEIEAILLTDDSDAALAAALVGSKLPVPVRAMPAAREAPSANGRLIAQLSDAYTPPA